VRNLGAPGHSPPQGARGQRAALEAEPRAGSGHDRPVDVTRRAPDRSSRMIRKAQVHAPSRGRQATHDKTSGAPLFQRAHNRVAHLGIVRR
jgi:hypothetical protein